MRYNRITHSLIVAVGIALTCLTATLAKKPGGGGGGGGGGKLSYAIVELDDAGGAFVGSYQATSDINELGDVVGTVIDVASGVWVPAYWTVDGANSVITPLNGNGFANGLNNFSEIVGHGNISSDPPMVAGKYWSSPTAEPINLPPLHPGLASVAHAINDAGVICGWANEPVFDSNGEPVNSTNVAVVWRVTFASGEAQITGPVRLPTYDERSQSYAITENDSDGLATVVGVFMTSGFAHTAAVQWTLLSGAEGTLSVSPDPLVLDVGNAAAFGVNNAGTTCGDFTASSGSPDARIWIGSSSISLDADAMPQTRALDINDNGVIVGSGGAHSLDLDAVVWLDAAARPVLLNKFLPRRNSPFTFLQQATAINEAGTITGVGWNGDDYVPFLAIPN